MFGIHSKTILTTKIQNTAFSILIAKRKGQEISVYYAALIDIMDYVKIGFNILEAVVITTASVAVS